jgi:cytochrome c556
MRWLDAHCGFTSCADATLRCEFHRIVGRNMLRVTAAVMAIAIGATLVYAQSAAIAQRQAILKTYGIASKQAGAMLKGAAPFDLAAVQTSLKTIADGAPKLKELFPDDSKTGGDTEALPALWENKADVLSRFDKLAESAQAAAAAIKDEASFKSEWPKVGANCGGCHRLYRKPN